MNPRSLILVTAGALASVALAATACSGDTTSITANPAEATGISVSGHGEVQAPPDTGFFDIGVQVRATTVEEARDRAAKAADAVIASVKSNRVDAKDIQTRNLAIMPEYDFKNPSDQRITGYMVTNTVAVKIRDLKTFSKIVDDAVRAGGNDVRLQGIRFGIEDNAKLLEQAREAAMKDARQKAEQLAKLGGVGLGKPVAISENQSTTPPPKLALDSSGRGAAADATVPTPIETGLGTVTVQITVRWSITG